VFKKFIGSEGSGAPIVEKRDLSAGGSDQIVFTTVAPIRGQGVRGEEILKNSTGKLNFGTFKVQVDLLRHAVAWTQVLKLMRFTGKTLDQLSADVMSEWAARTEQDHIQYVLRDTCLNNAGNNLLSAYGTSDQSGAGGSATELKYSEGLSTDIIQEAKQRLISIGGEPMNVGGNDKQEIPGYLFFGPDACLRPLRSDPDYLEAITQADSRGEDNKLYSGSYAKWDNNIIANHNVIIDTASGRQGSPLAPVHIHQNSGAYTPSAGTNIGVDGSDCFANFPGAKIDIPGGGGALLSSSVPAANAGHILFVDSNNDYQLWSVAGYHDKAGGGQVTGVGVVELDSRVDITGDTDGALTGNLTMYPANVAGTPIGYCLAMGKGALYYAKGAVSNEQIFHYDDFANSGNQAHLSAVGIQSVYGMAAYEDTNNRIPGVVLVETVRQIPGLSLSN
jgi:N4-gp56 family major capsid protein